MLTREENELVTRTGRGTPMGELFRRFWLPVALADEIPGPDCDPVRQRVLGEDLILFRDTSGRPGLVDAYCPHRGAPMFFGRNEEDGLRCVYHGWKFDVEGSCVDLPNAPEGETFKQKVRIDAYPCVENHGLIWAYLGPKDKQPPFPQLPWVNQPKGHVYVKKFTLFCNYLQAMEGDYDPSHAGFLHGTLDQNNSNPAVDATGGLIKDLLADKLGRYAYFENTDAGMNMVMTFKGPDNKRLYIAGPWSMPIFCTAGLAGPGIYSSNMRIPIDDESLMFYRLRWSNSPIPASEIQAYDHGEYVFPKVIPGTWITEQNKSNDYQIDRVAQRNYSYTGIKTFPLQDIAMMEDQRGALMDRTREHLASSDEAVIQVRRRLIKEARALVEGVEPKAPWNPRAFSIHTARIMVDEGTPLDQVAAQLRELIWQENAPVPTVS